MSFKTYLTINRVSYKFHKYVTPCEAEVLKKHRMSYTYYFAGARGNSMIALYVSHNTRKYYPSHKYKSVTPCESKKKITYFEEF